MSRKMKKPTRVVLLISSIIASILILSGILLLTVRGKSEDLFWCIALCAAAGVLLLLPPLITWGTIKGREIDLVEEEKWSATLTVLFVIFLVLGICLIVTGISYVFIYFQVQQIWYGALFIFIGLVSLIISYVVLNRNNKRDENYQPKVFRLELLAYNLLWVAVVLVVAGIYFFRHFQTESIIMLAGAGVLLVGFSISLYFYMRRAKAYKLDSSSDTS
ncbi:MAG: DUF981 family protein [Asgard group archaeon]|nr:DUF981 family protein [Asgard group archaeon]